MTEKKLEYEEKQKITSVAQKTNSVNEGTYRTRVEEPVVGQLL